MSYGGYQLFVILWKRFQKYTAMTKHKKYIHGRRSYKCDQCEYKTPKQNPLNNHICITHEGKEVAYPVCEI